MDDLVDKLKRVLEICGDKVESVHKTADGATALVNYKGVEHRVYVAPVKPFDVILEEPVVEY
jgi:hypothetical protein